MPAEVAEHVTLEDQHVGISGRKRQRRTGGGKRFLAARRLLQGGGAIRMGGEEIRPHGKHPVVKRNGFAKTTDALEEIALGAECVGIGGRGGKQPVERGVGFLQPAVPFEKGALPRQRGRVVRAPSQRLFV